MQCEEGGRAAKDAWGALERGAGEPLRRGCSGRAPFSKSRKAHGALWPKEAVMVRGFGHRSARQRGEARGQRG